MLWGGKAARSRKATRGAVELAGVRAGSGDRNATTGHDLGQEGAGRIRNGANRFDGAIVNGARLGVVDAREADGDARLSAHDSHLERLQHSRLPNGGACRRLDVPGVVAGAQGDDGENRPIRGHDPTVSLSLHRSQPMSVNVSRCQLSSIHLRSANTLRHDALQVPSQ